MTTLRSPLKVAFGYTRSLGPVRSAFAGGLKSGRFLGSRLSDGRVCVPPLEFDPVTHRAIRAEDLIEVASVGTVTSWTWVSKPVAGQPFQRPFGYALILLDGAGTALLHAVDVAGADRLATGMRVAARWSANRTGAITDVEAFVPSDVALPVPPGTTHDGPVTMLVTPVELDYDYRAGAEESRFFSALAQGRLVGQRCPACRMVYIPPRPACPVDGVPTTEEVGLPGTGTVTTFCVVNVPFPGQKIAPPYVAAYILLDGADIALQHLVLGCDADQVRMGMRVKAVWRPREEWGTTIENIAHFEPTGEPDADYDDYRKHL